MEVFGAIMGLSNFDNILLPPLAANPIILLNEILSLSYKVGAIWVEKDGFDVHAQVDHFSEVVDEECYPEALAIATLAGFFLAGNFSEVNVVVLDIIGRINKENPVPMILGEMLNGLDDLKEGM